MTIILLQEILSFSSFCYNYINVFVFTNRILVIYYPTHTLLSHVIIYLLSANN